MRGTCRATQPRTLRELAAIAASQLGVEPRLSAMPYAVLWAAGLVNPMAKELRETQHQFRRPFVLDSTARPGDVRTGADPDD